MLDEMVAWQSPVAGAGPSDRLPIHRSESPTGYSSAGCSPAEPASASPVTENSNSIPIRRSNQMRCSTFTAGMQSRSGSSCPSPIGASFLLCATGDISTLRRHGTGSGRGAAPDRQHSDSATRCRARPPDRSARDYIPAKRRCASSMLPKRRATPPCLLCARAPKVIES